jgi:hypothetical protein
LPAKGGRDKKKLLFPFSPPAKLSERTFHCVSFIAKNQQFSEESTAKSATSFVLSLFVLVTSQGREIMQNITDKS